MSTEKATYKDGICQRGDNVWLIKYYSGKDSDGKWKQTYETFHGTKTQAKARRGELMAQVQKGTHVDRSKVTVAEWIASRLDLGKASRKTRERYRELAKYVIDRLGDVRLQDLTPDQIEKCYKNIAETGRKNGAALSPTTVHHVHRLFNKCVRVAYRRGVIAANPFEKLERDELPKKADSRAVAFKPAELTELLANLERDGDWLLPIARLAAKTGMRRGELLASRWGAVDLDNRLIHVRETLEEVRGEDVAFKAPKTKGSRRTIQISETVAAELRAHWKASAEDSLKCGQRLTDTALLFPASPVDPGAPRKPRSVSEAFADRLTKYKLKKKELSFHSLRHTHASILISNRVSIIAVSKRLGHAKPSITLDIYSHMMPGDEEQAVQVTDQFFGAAVS